MYPPPPPTTDEGQYTYLFDDHASIVAGTGGGKSTDAANALVLDDMGVRRKFGKAILYAKNANLDDLSGSNLEEYLHSMRNLPPRKKFNPYWVVCLDYYYGRQSTRDWLEIITGE